MAEKTVSENAGTLKTLRNLWPYMWPADRADLKARVTWATLLLVVAKVTLVAGPYFFKWATDALAGVTKTPPPLPAFLLAPIMLVVAYNVLRLVQLGFNQLRDALFAQVGQYAVRQLAFRTFVHMHELSLRFHLERRTGGLSRIIERGTKGIETIVRFIMLNTAPTILEFALTAGIFAFTLSWNEFIYALAFIQSAEKKTVPVAVLTQLVEGDVYHWGSLMAGALLGSIPVAILYSFFVDYYVASLTGAVKE